MQGLLQLPSPDKVQHFLVTLLVVLVVGVLVLAYRDRARVDLADQLAALATIFAGVVFGVIWEIVEFLSDWVLDTTFQPSNTDTMMKFLASDIAAVVAALLAGRVYCHWLRGDQRERLGGLAVWMFGGASRVLDRHGFAIAVAFSALIVLAVGGLWFAGRPVPGFPIT